MSEEFEDLSSRLPDFGAAIAQRIMGKKLECDSTNPNATVDPYKLILNKNKPELGLEPIRVNVPKWSDESIKELENYCQKMGIFGFKCGAMNPKAALSMLKRQVGDYSEVPLDQRIPEGYEKSGTISGKGPNYPYENGNKKVILHG